jgi:hypothetical protein
MDIGLARAGSSKLLPGDSYPQEHVALGGFLGVSVRVAKNLTVLTCVDGLGSWFKFSSSIQGSGSITEFDPGLVVGVESSLLRTTNAQFLVGCGVEYGEVRSWVHNQVYAFPLNSEGATNYLTGGRIHVRVLSSASSPLAVFAELSESVYFAHAPNSSLHSSYDWVGSKLSLAIGLNVALRRASPQVSTEEPRPARVE